MRGWTDRPLAHMGHLVPPFCFPMPPEHGFDDGLDPAELRFRTDSVPAGVWVTFIVCVAGFAYVVGWDHRHSTQIALLIGFAAVGGGLVMALPWERIVRS